MVTEGEGQVIRGLATGVQVRKLRKYRERQEGPGECVAGKNRQERESEKRHIAEL